MREKTRAATTAIVRRHSTGGTAQGDAKKGSPYKRLAHGTQVSICMGVLLLVMPQALRGESLTCASAASVDMDASQLDRIDGLVAESIDRGDLPGCVVLIMRHGQIVFHRAFGHRQLEPERLPMLPDTVFDMASLTKPVATATSIMLLVERGRIRLGDKYGAYLPEFRGGGKDEITIEQMLTHQAGFVPDSPLAEYENPLQIWPKLFALQIDYEPGTRFVYSDVGYQMLGKLVESQTGQSLDAFTRENVFQPLGMAETGFLPADTLRLRAATTERREERWMRGEVHDPRAYAMGGIAGHAGLFSTAPDLAVYANMMLDHGYAHDQQLLSPATVRRMTSPVNVDGNLRGLGWDIRSRYSTNRGELMSERAFGHGGFTGTAMWIDPTYDLAVIFLSNRVHPTGQGMVNPLAGRIGSVAVASIREQAGSSADGDAKSPMSPVRGVPLAAEEVLPGIDVLVRDHFRPLAGQRVGLITNHTGVDRNGRRTIDLLQQATDVQLVAIFSPEHGIRGVRDDGHIQNDTDSATGLPIFSLYGELRAPTAESLEPLDALVFDIQDIGTRFYTYISTMKNAMEAAAKHGKKFVVLDRPNPIGGVAVQGPVLDEGQQSFVGCHPLPVRHGMTVGELARMIADESHLQLALTVIPVEHWRRSMLWDATGLTWIDPSPNMRSLTQALLYPGIGLLETTNVSVGRGTDRPFEILGAPYIDEREFARQLRGLSLPGLTFVPRRFTPNASKFAQESCGGVDIIVTDWQRVEPVRAGLAVAWVLRKRYPEHWEIDRLPRLLGDRATFDALRERAPLSAVWAIGVGEVREFMPRRRAYLLYQ